jgi:alpha-amylase/alpha-mannosidase (GH57 family)
VKENAKVRLALLWHMHQPVYGLPGEGEFRLPWVRMHALRGYLWLARLAEKFPKVRQTVNLVPSLLSQIEAYSLGVSDAVENLARRDAAALTETDKRFILEHFFSINARHHILPHARYRQLLEESHREGGGWALVHWQASEWRDLQTWFHLTSLDPDSKLYDPLAQRLLKQGRLFGETDKLAVLELYRKALREIVPAYKKLWDDGVLELSTTPYYHPILPILCDARIGREANPSLPDDDLTFRWPEDAALQIEKALTAFTGWFGRPPLGIWPSEGSVSAEVLGLFERFGVTWCATDEAVLAKSWLASGKPLDRLNRNQPFRPDGCNVSIFFRNHDLSDRLGFAYQNRPAADAVDDFVAALLGMASLAKPAPLVSVILDGENPWEHYPHGGKDFLETLFARLSDHPQIETVTFSQAAAEAASLPKLLPGSWINGNFDIWIGDPQDRNAWRLVATARRVYEEKKGDLGPELSARVLELILRAQGSDWTWWYGSEHPTKDLLIFDGLLRDHLIEAFRLMGLEAPEVFHHPVAGGRQGSSESGQIHPKALFRPGIQTRPTPFFEWVGAGQAMARGGGGSMHQVSGNELAVDYAFSRDGWLSLRAPLPLDLDGPVELTLLQGDLQLEFSRAQVFCAQGELTAEISLPEKSATESLRLQIRLGDKRFSLSLPPPDPRQIGSHWLV